MLRERIDQLFPIILVKMFASARTLWRFSPPFPRPTDRHQGYAESPGKREGKATEKKPFSFTSFLSAVVQKREGGGKERVRQEKRTTFKKEDV